MLNKLLKFVLICCFSLFLFNGWMYIQQPKMVFYPLAELKSTPKEWGLPYDDVTLTTSDNVRLHGWYLPAKESKQVILFFHGNGGNISHRGDSIYIFHKLKLNVLIIDYPGYGESKGCPSEAALYQSANAALQYLISDKKTNP